MELLADEPAQAEILRLLDEATRQLLDSARLLADVDVRAPSRLPGWSRGHVLTHVARNADGLGGVLIGAAAGERASMYPSWEVRDTDIAAGADRPAAALLADVEASAEGFRAALLRYPADRADAQFTSPAGWWRPVRDAGYFRCREVVLHHIDLGTGFTLADAHAPGLVERLLVDSVEAFGRRPDLPPFRLTATDLELGRQFGAGGPDVRGPATALAGWLTGRTDGSDLQTDGPLPTLPAWA